MASRNRSRDEAGPAERMIAAILFDLFETLVTERNVTPVRASSLGERLGLDGPDFRKAWKQQRFNVICGHVSFSEALVEIGTTLGGALIPETVHSLVEERCREKSALFDRIDPEIPVVLRQLHERGVKLSVISNCFAEDVQAWPRCAAAQWFDTAVFSFEVGAAKPELAIYGEALQRLGVAAADTAFVGDGGDDELLGAERAGLRAAQATWYRGDMASLPTRIPRLSSWQAVLELAAAG
jgi:FMN phosphatase YigB (HAD superfamily)